MVLLITGFHGPIETLVLSQSLAPSLQPVVCKLQLCFTISGYAGTSGPSSPLASTSTCIAVGDIEHTATPVPAQAQERVELIFGFRCWASDQEAGGEKVGGIEAREVGGKCTQVPDYLFVRRRKGARQYHGGLTPTPRRNPTYHQHRLPPSRLLCLVGTQVRSQGSRGGFTTP